MRTVKRTVQSLNAGKLAALKELVCAFNKEKSSWVDKLAGLPGFYLLANIRKHVRDPAVKDKYASKHGLSARCWKCALDEAVGMVERYWQAHFVTVRSAVNNTKLCDAQKFYCYCILNDYGQLHDLFAGDLPPLPKPPKAKPGAKARAARTAGLPALTRAQQIEAVRSLRAAIRAGLPKFVTVKKSRSVVLDQNCYSVFEHGGVQYAKILTLTKGERIALPLDGFCATRTARPRTHRPIKHTAHFGNIRIVLGASVQLHTAYDTEKTARAARRGCINEKLALDAGYADTFADQNGNLYGPGLGPALMAATDTLHDKGVARNRLHALEKHYRATGKTRKANNLRQCNLGTVKKEALTRRQHAHVDCIINTALNQVLDQRPAAVIRENLAHQFEFKLGRKPNRRLSAWTKGRIAGRTDFKVDARGSRVELANAAYSSQTCSQCGWVEQSNRHGHVFQCQKCRHADHAGTNAAKNLRQRPGDPEISLYTPHTRVKEILLARFEASEKRRLETAELVRAAATVYGQTVETACALPMRQIRARGRKRGEAQASPHPAVNHRANN